MDDELDALFNVEPDRFVAARDALVKRLKAEKRKDDAAMVAALRRPPIVVWAMNRVARQNPTAVEELIRAGGAALQAQNALMNGGPAAQLHDAVEHRRTVVAALVQESVSALDGKPSPTDVVPQLRLAYEQVSVDASLAATLRTGRLTALPLRSDDDASPAAPASTRSHLRLVPSPVEPAAAETMRAHEVEAASGAAERVAAERVAAEARAQAHLARMEAAMAEAQESAAALAWAQQGVAHASTVSDAATTRRREASEAAADLRRQIHELEQRLAELVTLETAARTGETSAAGRLAAEEAELTAALERADAAKTVLMEIARSIH
jgi:hypothetical protein